MSEAKRYWFPAKSYGWGWGVPGTWQGLGSPKFVCHPDFGERQLSFFRPPLAPMKFALCITALCAVLVGICYAKGEPPRWRWGAK